jgi:hypothetical protein
MKHEYVKHDKCEIDNCLICDGGLLVCTVCKGAESSLTTECCGKPLTDKDQYCVSNGDDYENGKWVRPYIHA